VKWKYGLILVQKGNTPDEDQCELVELYSNEDKEYTSFCKAVIISKEDLFRAYEDVDRDGVNTYFYDNGKFYYNSETDWWDYLPNS
jgi:hypothetical protein